MTDRRGSRETPPSPSGRFDPGFLPATDHGWRQHWYRLIFHHDHKAEQRFDLVLIIAILGSIAVVLLDSMPQLNARWHFPLYLAEWGFTLLFTVDYVMRLLVVRCPECKLGDHEVDAQHCRRCGATLPDVS